MRETLENLAYAFQVAAMATLEFANLVSGIVTKEAVYTAAFVAVALSIGKITLALGKAAVGLGGFVAAMRATTTAAGALGLVMGLGSGGLGGILLTLVGAGGVILAGVSAFKALNTEMTRTEELTWGLSAATDDLIRARIKMRESDLKAAVEHARSEKRLQEIIAGGQGYISREQAIAAQRKEIEDLEARLSAASRELRTFDRDTPGPGPAGEPLRLGIGGADEGAGWTGGSVRDPINFGKGHLSESDPVAAYREFQHSMAQAAVAEVAEANREAAEATRRMWETVGASVKQSMGSTIDGIVDGTKNLSDVMDGIYKTLAKMALKWAAFSFLGPAGIGLPGFAGGGVMPHRGLAVVGERGPELVGLPGGARVHSNADSRRMLRGGGGQMEIAIRVEGATDDAMRNRIRAELDQAIPRIVELANSSAIGDASRPSRFNSAVRRA